MECPHCGKELIVDSAPKYNVEAYGNPVVAIARCCGKGVVLSLVSRIDVNAYYGDRNEDNWGNPIKHG